jgi:hypothetical protein
MHDTAAALRLLPQPDRQRLEGAASIIRVLSGSAICINFA